MTVNRRKVLQIAAVGGAGVLAASQLVRPGLAQRAIAQADDPYAAEVDAGLEYFREQAAIQLPLVQDLLAAINSGDLEWAKEAYIEARPPYEQIEVLAASFEQTDRNIDARPADFEGGEFNREFRGFHRIEIFLFREEDLTRAIPYARGLVRSVRQLISDLDQRQNFNSTLHFEGMIGLATEVSSKKICSEEEAWSDQSLLIFKENWNGIFSQFEPFTAAVNQLDNRAAPAVRRAYEAAIAVVEPYFVPDRTAATPYSSLGVPERREIVRASYRLRNTLLNAMEVLGLA